MVTKFELGGGWKSTYFSGQVTTDDVEVSEPDTRESNGSRAMYIESTVVIRLKEEIRQALEYTDKPVRSYDPVPGITKIVVSDRIEKITTSNIKAMRTKHANKCEEAFTPEEIEKRVNSLVRLANQVIDNSRDDFQRRIASNLENVKDDAWDNSEKIKELVEERSKLQAQISGINANIRTMLDEEVRGWLDGKGCDPEIRDVIVSNASYSFFPKIFRM